MTLPQVCDQRGPDMVGIREVLPTASPATHAAAANCWKVERDSNQEAFLRILLASGLLVIKLGTWGHHFYTLEVKAALKTNQSQRTRCCCFIMKEEKDDPAPFPGSNPVPVALPLVSGNLSEDLAVVHLKFTAAAACKWLAVTANVVRGYCAK